MKLKVKDLQNALIGIETDRQLSPEIVESALKEALAKAYRKHVNMNDVHVRVDFSDGHIHIIPERVVVEEVQDDALEVELAEARKKYPDIQVGDMFPDPEVDFSQFGRADVLIAKNVIKQKIREAEKELVYEEYCDKVDDMIYGTIETVEEKFALVDIGKTKAVMKHTEQIPTENYYPGQRLRVVIIEVNKESKGAQVLVSRATPVFVRRLFELEVPEIYQGTIEIKAIAREPGERCKIAVYSHNENIDPIGACIGPRGMRVQAIINELNGEKIDIFEWSDNISELIKNALSPSEAIAVFPNEEVKDGLIVVVPDNQLSLAIGKKGKNARLAVKLSNRKIDIKSVSEMEEAGIDYQALSDAMQKEYEEKKAAERAYKQQQRIDALKQEDVEIENINDVDFTYDEDVEDVEDNAESMAGANTAEVPKEGPAVPTDDTLSEMEESKEDTAEPSVEKALSPEEKEEKEMEEAARVAKERRKGSRASEVKEYTSKFESMADASHKEEAAPAKPKKKKEQPKKEEKESDKKTSFEQMKPIYTEEELAEIEAEEQEEEENRWDDDVDYEEYDEYYD